MLPVVIIVVIMVPLVIGGFLFVRRSKAQERTLGESDAGALDDARREDEFAAADAYTEQWREQNPTRSDLLD